MQLTADRSTAGQDELPERWKRLLACIHEYLKSCRIGLRYPRHVAERLAGSRGQQSSDIEELVLYPTEFELKLITG